ncbi:MAG: NUDIX domain-containing protein [Bryobacteraceae bacterium]
MQRDEVFHRFVFRIEEVTLRHERFDGAMSGEIKRLILHRGDSVALLLANRRRDEVLLCEQFRLPTYREDGTGWIIELPAGILEANEAPEECARREAVEETGYDVRNMQSIALVYLSPGGSSERIHIFYAEISEGDRTTEGGGLASENEDIRMIWMSVEEAWRQCQNGGIRDAKTLIALQWLMLRGKLEDQ